MTPPSKHLEITLITLQGSPTPLPRNTHRTMDTWLGQAELLQTSSHVGIGYFRAWEAGRYGLPSVLPSSPFLHAWIWFLPNSSQPNIKKKGLNQTGATLAKHLLLQPPVPAWARSEEMRPCHMGNSWAIANNSQQSFWLTRKRPTQFQFASGKAALCSLGRLQQSWIAFSNIPRPSQQSSKHYHLIVPTAHKFLPALAQGKYTDFANLAFILIFSPHGFHVTWIIRASQHQRVNGRKNHPSMCFTQG